MSDGPPAVVIPAPALAVPPPEPEARTKKRSGHGVTIARNSFWLLVDTVSGVGASFYCSIIVARGLGPERMGYYNYVLWFAAVLRVITELAIPVTVRKFSAEFMGREDYTTLKTLLRSALVLQGKMAFVGVAGGLVFMFTTIAPEQRGFATMAIFTIVPSLFLSVPAGALWATENLRHNVMSSLVGTTVNIVGVSVSILIFHWGLLGVVSSLLASRIVDCTIRFILFHREYGHLPGKALKTGLDPVLRKRMVGFGARNLVLWGFQVLLWDRMEVFFLKGLSVPAEIAFFSISFTLVYALFYLPASLSGSASATMMVEQGRAPNEVGRIAATMTWFMLLVAAPVYFGVAALADPLFHLLYGTRYLPAIPVLVVLALFGVCRALMAPVEQLLIATEQQMFFIGWAGAVAVVNVVGNLLLIPPYGALGAAYAKGVAQVIAAAGFVAFMVWKFKVTLPYYRMVKLLIVCTLMFLGVRTVGRHMTSLPALLVGIPTGAVIFGLLTRWLRCLDGRDRDRLSRLERLMPERMKTAYLAVVGFLVPV